MMKLSYNLIYYLYITFFTLLSRHHLATILSTILENKVRVSAVVILWLVHQESQKHVLERYK
jgi:hypothetical protein